MYVFGKMKFNAKGYNIKKNLFTDPFSHSHLPELHIVSNLFFPKKLSDHIQAHIYFPLLSSPTSGIIKHMLFYNYFLPVSITY